MNCKALGIIGKIIETSQPEIVKGSDAFIKTQTVFKDDCYKIAKIEGFVGATGYLRNVDENIVNIPGTLESEDLGTLKFDLPSTMTEDLKASEEASFEIRLEDASGIKYIQFQGKLKIKNRLF